MAVPARQLDLLKGLLQRGKRAPPATEFATHCAIADTLRVSLMPQWVWFHVGNGERRDKLAGARLQRMGVKPGVSDFILIAPPAGRFHALELKRRGVRPTREQFAFLASVTGAGGVAAWADSYEEAITCLKKWQAVRVVLP